MEAILKIVVRVSDMEHAKLIEEDVRRAIKNRTSIYHICDVKQSTAEDMTIEQYGQEHVARMMRSC